MDIQQKSSEIQTPSKPRYAIVASTTFLVIYILLFFCLGLSTGGSAPGQIGLGSIFILGIVCLANIIFPLAITLIPVSFKRQLFYGGLLIVTYYSFVFFGFSALESEDLTIAGIASLPLLLPIVVGIVRYAHERSII